VPQEIFMKPEPTGQTGRLPVGRRHIAGSVPEVNFVALRIREGELSEQERLDLTEGLTACQWEMLEQLVPLTAREMKRWGRTQSEAWR